ncbi:GNAT family N-acetyltransferase [Haladaptatus pallidirubidus]|uniref:GNAT family N-acetyltransferase n=1 Tax=Haladaptatus pallidirubidus TaxID=1008152 RepID=A0AAV3UDT7_9EURY|nr:N-acetyltransferase [Haladaptatus pallidirubidus]
MEIRPYDGTETDAKQLWKLKRGFELGLGEGTGAEDKAEIYSEKLTDDYREEYLNWVGRCVADDERCVTVAGDSTDDGPEDGELAGYVFVLPARLAFIWDAAVLNEIFVRPEHRGTGVADDLMDAAIELARDQSLPLDRLVLDVDRENDRAQSFYDRYGFEHWGEMVARKL